MSEATATLSVKLPVAVKNRLDRLAQDTSKSKSSLAADAISSFVELYEWQLAEIRRGIREAEADEFASEKEVRAVFDKWIREG